MADSTLEPSALAQWQALFRAKLAQGYSTLDAIDAIDREAPGLSMEAKVQHATQASHDAVPHDGGDTLMKEPYDYATREALASVDRMLVRKEIGTAVAERLRAQITAASVAAHPAVPAMGAHEAKALAGAVRSQSPLTAAEAEAWEQARYQHLYGQPPRPVAKRQSAPVVKNAADPQTFFTMCAQYQLDHPDLSRAEAEQAVANSPAGTVCFAAYYAARPHLRGRG